MVGILGLIWVHSPLLVDSTSIVALGHRLVAITAMRYVDSQEDDGHPAHGTIGCISQQGQGMPAPPEPLLNSIC